MKRNLKENTTTGKIYNVAQDKWTLENVAAGIKSFYSEYKRYPTANDFDTYHKLPSARHIQRKFHGLKKLRETLKLKQKDFSSGTSRSKRGEVAYDKKVKRSSEIYNILVKKLGKTRVQRDFSLTDDNRTSLDFYLRNEAQNCALDALYSKDERSLIGSINSKQTKYDGDNYLNDPVVFLSTNRDISQDRVDLLVSRKKNALGKNQYVLAIESLEDFLNKFKKNKKVSDILKREA